VHVVIHEMREVDGAWDTGLARAATINISILHTVSHCMPGQAATTCELIGLTEHPASHDVPAAIHSMPSHLHARPKAGTHHSPSGDTIPNSRQN
jgi:hypothetical protein